MMADSNSTLFTTLRAVRCLSLYSWPCGLDARRATGYIFGALASLQGIKIARFYTAIGIFCVETRTPGYRRKKGGKMRSVRVRTSETAFIFVKVTIVSGT